MNNFLSPFAFLTYPLNTASLSLLSGVYYELQDSYASIVVNSSYINTYNVIQRGRIYNKVSFTNGDKTSSSIYVVTIPRGVEMGDHQLNFNGERIFVKKASTINADNDFIVILDLQENPRESK